MAISVQEMYRLFFGYVSIIHSMHTKGVKKNSVRGGFEGPRGNGQILIAKLCMNQFTLINPISCNVNPKYTVHYIVYLN